MYYSYLQYLPANRCQISPISPTIHDGQDDGNGMGLMCARPYKLRGIFLDTLGSIMVNLSSIGTMP